MKYWQILSWVSLLSATPASALEKPLFERLGRNKGIEALSARFISHLSKDARLNDNPGIKTMKKEISELEATHRLASALNKASGGPAKASRADLLKGIKAEVELGAREWFYAVHPLSPGRLTVQRRLIRCIQQGNRIECQEHDR